MMLSSLPLSLLLYLPLTLHFFLPYSCMYIPLYKIGSKWIGTSITPSNAVSHTQYVLKYLLSEPMSYCLSIEIQIVNSLHKLFLIYYESYFFPNHWPYKSAVPIKISLTTCTPNCPPAEAHKWLSPLTQLPETPPGNSTDLKVEGYLLNRALRPAHGKDGPGVLWNSSQLLPASNRRAEAYLSAHGSIPEI